MYKEERDEDDPYETAPLERVEGAVEINPTTGRTFHMGHEPMWLERSLLKVKMNTV